MRLDLSLSVAGVDASTKRTGIARPDGAVVSIEPARRRGEDRLLYCFNAASSALIGADVVVIEGYPYGVQGKGVRALAEVRGVVLLAAALAGAVVAHVNPSTLKVYATGKGNADKADMMRAAAAAGGNARNDDEADALWLRAMGRHHYLKRAPIHGARSGELERRHVDEARRRALRAVQWPRAHRNAR